MTKIDGFCVAVVLAAGVFVAETVHLSRGIEPRARVAESVDAVGLKPHWTERSVESASLSPGTIEYAPEPAPRTGYVLYIYSPTEPAVELPEPMVRSMGAVVDCESDGDPEAVGRHGERGSLQVHPIHRQAMKARGLSFERERDRLLFASELWERSGWEDWACRP